MAKYFLFYSDVEWDIFNRKEMIILFSKLVDTEDRVVVINRPADLFPGLFRKGFHRQKVKESTTNPIKKINDNLTLIRPLTLFHDHAGSYLFKGWPNLVNTWLIERSIKQADIYPKDNDEIVIWLYEQIHWTVGKLFSRLNQKKRIVWEIFDDYRFTAQGNPRKPWIAADKMMLKQADIIFTLTSGLKKKYDLEHNNIHILGNGYNADYFMKVNDDKDIKQKFKNISHPRIAYMGNIRNWIDFDILCTLISDNQNWNFIFIGPIDPTAQNQFAKLQKESNVIYLGKQKPQDLGYFLKDIDVGLIPYIKSSFTENVKPIKLYEILSSGTPIVTSMKADLEESKGAIYFFNNLNSAQEKIEQALVEVNPVKCKELAKEWSWENVVKKRVLPYLELNR